MFIQIQFKVDGLELSGIGLRHVAGIILRLKKCEGLTVIIRLANFLSFFNF
jgi:hypothetical protein